MSKATSQAFSSYRRNRTVLSFRERYRLTVFVSNGTVAVMAQRGVSLKSVLTCYEKNKMIFFFIWAVIDFLTINISWFLLNIKQHPSPISRKPQTVLNVWMAWIVCIVLFSYHKCACPMSRAIAATFCRWGSPHFATAHGGQLTEGCSLGAGETMPSATSCGQLKNQCHLKVHSMGVGGRRPGCKAPK